MDVEGLLKSLKEHKVRFVVITATTFPVRVAASRPKALGMADIERIGAAGRGE